MTVGELIAKLEKLPLHVEVVVADGAETLADAVLDVTGPMGGPQETPVVLLLGE